MAPNGFLPITEVGKAISHGKRVPQDCRGMNKQDAVLLFAYYQQQMDHTDAKYTLITTSDAPFDDPTDSVDLVLPGNIDTEVREGFPVLEVEEDSDTFRTILLLCYPYIAPEIQSVFAVAVANGWKKLGEAAARNILARPFNQAISDVEELNEISTCNLLHLQNYHVWCGYAAQIRIRTGSLSWLRRKTSGLFFLHKTPHCQWCRAWNSIFDLGYADATLLHGHAWLTDTYFGLVNMKLLSVPWPQVALDDDILDQTIFASTKECGGQWDEMAGSQICRFGKIVAEEIDKQVSKVPLNIE
ncbi:hypothetical protein EDD18DRAFT_1101953 [Armillaria luteobubalina]|uniref:BTB domain-containing protein n=1 Tax=Armillaria luteobubalina TaxID=153913 RepID=A0AA39QDP4_9AGAR|nr:hypothetical protein EDD18DRAFT_1101953 [Armillaria luteobubalina]